MWHRKHDKDKPAVTPDIGTAQPNDAAFIKEVREVIRKYGYRAQEDGISLTAPIRYEDTKKTVARFSWKLEIYQFRDDPFAEAQPG